LPRLAQIGLNVVHLRRFKNAERKGLKEELNRTKPAMAGLIWAIFARTFLFLAGLILALYGLDGLVGGEILPAAGRGGHISRPRQLAGMEARLYGLIFVCLGAVLVALATGLLQCIQNRMRRRSIGKFV
jgi:hypothetical protein